MPAIIEFQKINDPYLYGYEIVRHHVHVKVYRRYAGCWDVDYAPTPTLVGERWSEVTSGRSFTEAMSAANDFLKQCAWDLRNRGKVLGVR